jgi:hypothetical protein
MKSLTTGKRIDTIAKLNDPSCAGVSAGLPETDPTLAYP